MTGISEGVVEEACLGFFSALGYQSAYGPELGPGGVILVNLSGRGDKDVDTAARWFGVLGDELEQQ